MSSIYHLLFLQYLLACIHSDGMKQRVWYQVQWEEDYCPTPQQALQPALAQQDLQHDETQMLQLIYKESWIYDVSLIHNGIELKALMLFYCRSDIYIHMVSDG